MPYVKICSDDEWQDPEIQLKIREAVKHFSNLRLYHADLHRRHIGLCEMNGATLAVLIDFASVKKVDETELEKSFATMLLALDL
jgi:hypothetical protein